MEQQRQTLSRRNFLKVTAAGVGVTALGGLLSACAPPAGQAGGSAAPGTAPIEISWYEWGDVLDKDIADRCIADFQTEHPNITIRLEQSPTGYYDKLQTALAGGTAADIINNQTWLFQSFSAKGVYTALDELRARDDYNTPYPEA